jgi:hypothetical protein
MVCTGLAKNTCTTRAAAAAASSCTTSSISQMSIMPLSSQRKASSLTDPED